MHGRCVAGSSPSRGASGGGEDDEGVTAARTEELERGGRCFGWRRKEAVDAKKLAVLGKKEVAVAFCTSPGEWVRIESDAGAARTRSGLESDSEKRRWRNASDFACERKKTLRGR